MKLKTGQKFADKHGADARLNKLIKEHIIRQTKNNELPMTQTRAISFHVDY